MFKKILNALKPPVVGTVKLSFIALNETDEPYEDVAVMPYQGEFDQKDIELKFKNFMRLRKHLVVEITVLERTEQ